MQIFISKYKGKTLTLTVESDYTVLQMKEKFKEKVPAELMPYIYFIYAGKVLEDSKKLSDYHIVKESTINLSFRTNQNSVKIFEKIDL